MGVAVFVEEELLNAVTALSGSGPAYVYLFAKAMMDSGIGMGMDINTAKKLAMQTLEGSIKMLKGDKTPEELISMVRSKGGTTYAALEVFKNENFEQTIDKAMQQAKARADELSQ